MTVIADLPSAIDISRDGLVVLGDSDAPGFGVSPLRWTAATGAQSIGFIRREPAGSEVAVHGYAGAVNGDGSVIVGGAIFNFNDGPFPTQRTVPFRWDPVHGARAVAASDGTYPAATANDVTPDGTVMIGTSLPVAGSALLFRWTEATGYQTIIPVVPLNQTFGAPRVSADGNAIIAGRNYWSPATGAITIEQLLTQSGCDFTGWTLTGAAGISDNGLTIAGNGVSPTGQTQAWIATVPSPATGAVAFAALVLGARRRRK